MTTFQPPTSLPFRLRQKNLEPNTSPLDRDPRQYPFGLLLVERRLFNGIDGFSWFASEALAVEYLRSFVWLELGYLEENECSSRSLFRSAFRDTSRMRWDRLNSINASQDELQVIWFGSFTALSEGLDTFAESLVSKFQSINRCKIYVSKERQHDEFIRYIQSYRSMSS